MSELDVLTDDLTALDWNVGTPCEGTGHFEVHIPRGDARWIQRGTCPECSRSADMNVCEGGRQYRLTCDRIKCTACRKASLTDAWGFRFDPIKEAS